MQVPSMIQCLAFICNLQAALAHSESHGVHVDFTWVWLSVCWFGHVCIFIFEKWNLDIDFFSSSFSYRLGNSTKSWMSVDGGINRKL